MAAADDLLHSLRTWHRMPAGQLVERLRISRATLMRAVQALGPQVVSRGAARRTAYAARRAVRGSLEALPLYRVDASGEVQEVAALHPTYPAGTAADYLVPFEWPLDRDMADGWFDGLPYPLDDMRPQGFLGRNFARANAALLQVPENPQHWSEDDVLHALSLLGSDQPGCYILGEPALRHWLAQQPAPPLADGDAASAYAELADHAMVQGVAVSSAGGEFPKFTAVRSAGGEPWHVIVKFSGSDDSAGTQRWADLLVCEHLAGRAVREHLGLDAAESTIVQAAGRTFLEVRRFDRHGARGRSPLCSWAALNAGLFGLVGKPWTAAAAVLRGAGHIDEDTQARIDRLWHFGRLIANTDMHDGNLSFRPGLKLAPVYDMLPMLYAPERGVELPERSFRPVPPIPSERAAWTAALPAARSFWDTAAADARIGAGFRAVCARNAQALANLA